MKLLFKRIWKSLKKVLKAKKRVTVEDIKKMNLKQILAHARKTFTPQQLTGFHLTLMPTLIAKVIEVSEKESRSPRATLKQIEKIVKLCERRIEKTGVVVIQDAGEKAAGNA